MLGMDGVGVGVGVQEGVGNLTLPTVNASQLHSLGD